MTTSLTNPDRLLPDDSPGEIVLVDDDLRLAAVERLVSTGIETDREHARRFLRYARANKIDLRAQWARINEHGHVRDTVLAVPNPGRTAMIFVSPVRDVNAIRPVARLVDHASRQLEGSDGPIDAVSLAQVLLDPAHALEREMFRHAEFGELARLSYLERPLPGARLARQIEWPEGVTLESYHERRRDDLLEILQASYVDTLDCPGLQGLRETPDILNGHLATGQHDPSLWTLLYLDARPAGVLLLNPSVQGHCVELVYLGFAAFARNRGLGARLLHHGLNLIRSRRERIVTLAVDENNSPALKLYQRFGFKRMLRRTALIRPLASTP